APPRITLMFLVPSLCHGLGPMHSVMKGRRFRKLDATIFDGCLDRHLSWTTLAGKHRIRIKISF
ncbi:MAG: hypothetical protein VXW08_03820, partial [Candidatus Thermoplasmatota archaeon]|nr:hypothetical protein [Candidatus Thermoplasmatota archaeon]